MAKNNKIAELMLYICELCEKDPAFGVTKLNKLLFFSDFETYLKLGRTITGHRYIKAHYGPVPDGHRGLRHQRYESGELGCIHVDFHGKPQKKPVANRPAKTDEFNNTEKKTVEEIVRRYWGMTASDITKLSHEFIGYKLANLHEEIPHYVARAKKITITTDVIYRAIKLQKEIIAA
jgi:hypothetical protein